MAGRPKYTPKIVFKKRRGYNRKRIIISIPEDFDVAIQLHSEFIARELGKRSVSPSDAILDIFNRSYTVQRLLPKARAIIKSKQDQHDEHNETSSGGDVSRAA